MPLTSYIHIGAPKCGSSSIQKWLSASTLNKLPSSTRNGNSVSLQYQAINHKQGLIDGRAISLLLPQQITGYVSSVRPKELLDMPSEVINQAKASISRCNHDIILSCEGWLSAMKNPKFIELLLSIVSPTVQSRNVEVIAIVRPPAKFICSHWWQFGAWSHKGTFDEYIQRIIPLTKWIDFLKPLALDSRVTKLHILPLNSGILNDIADLLQVQPPENSDRGIANKSLPQSALYLLQNRRDLKPAPKDVFIDFILSDIVSRSKRKYAPTPWCISREQLNLIQDQTKSATINLLESLESDLRQRFLADPAWISTEWANDITPICPTQLPEPSQEELLDLTRDILESHQQSIMLLRKHKLISDFYGRP